MLCCRSVYGGFVQWRMGELDDGADSLAVQLAPAAHWPNLRYKCQTERSHGKNLFRIPDPGVKKAPDPGSGSATLVTIIPYPGT
jgi:hypothetical protein